MKKLSSLEFENHFPLSKEELHKILRLSLSQGGDFSEIFLEYKTYNFINMEEDIIKETAESISLGLGVRVLSGEKTGYGYTNDISLKKVKKAALTAASIASTPDERHAASLTPSSVPHNYYPVRESFHDMSLEKKISLVQECYLSAHNHDPKIKKVKV